MPYFVAPQNSIYLLPKIAKILGYLYSWNHMMIFNELMIYTTYMTKTTVLTITANGVGKHPQLIFPVRAIIISVMRLILEIGAVLEEGCYLFLNLLIVLRG